MDIAFGGLARGFKLVGDGGAGMGLVGGGRAAGGSRGTGGATEQICSPSSFNGTGWLQFEHLTVGRT